MSINLSGLTHSLNTLPLRFGQNQAANLSTCAKQPSCDTFTSSSEPLFTEYLKHDMSDEEIVEALKDKKTMGRSFLGSKSKIVKLINGAKDRNEAIDVFNTVLNTTKSHSVEIFKTLMTSEAYANRYITFDRVCALRDEIDSANLSLMNTLASQGGP